MWAAHVPAARFLQLEGNVKDVPDSLQPLPSCMEAADVLSASPICLAATADRGAPHMCRSTEARHTCVAAPRHAPCPAAPRRCTTCFNNVKTLTDMIVHCHRLVHVADRSPAPQAHPASLTLPSSCRNRAAGTW